MIEDISVDETIDCRGLSCPMPMLKVKKALSGMGSGQVLRMMGTDQGTGNDIDTGARKNNAEYLGAREEDGYTSYFLRKM